MTNIGYYQFEKAQDSTTTNNASGNISNEQQNQTANKQVSSQGNQSQYSSTTKENNTQSTQSNEAQALPETGEESNSGLVTIVASVLLATGSLLAFRRTSNSK